jgi:hypothetical protein
MPAPSASNPQTPHRNTSAHGADNTATTPAQTATNLKEKSPMPPKKKKPSVKKVIAKAKSEHLDMKKSGDAIDKAFDRLARPTLTASQFTNGNKRLATHKRIWKLEHEGDSDAW